MHTSKKLKKDRTDMVVVNRNLEPTFAIAPVGTRDVITVETSFEDVRSPLPKKQRGDGSKENNQTEFINSLVGDLLDKCAKELHSNFQCGDCAKIFYKQDDLMMHIEKHHGQAYGNLCEECGKAFKDEGDMNRHIINHHIQDQASTCVISEKIAEKQGRTRKVQNNDHRNQ